MSTKCLASIDSMRMSAAVRNKTNICKQKEKHEQPVKKSVLFS